MTAPRTTDLPPATDVPTVEVPVADPPDTGRSRGLGLSFQTRIIVTLLAAAIIPLAAFGILLIVSGSIEPQLGARLLLFMLAVVVIVVIIGGAAIALDLIAPLREMSAVVTRVSAGDMSQPIPVRGTDALAQLARFRRRDHLGDEPPAVRAPVGVEEHQERGAAGSLLAHGVLVPARALVPFGGHRGRSRRGLDVGRIELGARSRLGGRLRAPGRVGTEGERGREDVLGRSGNRSGRPIRGRLGRGDEGLDGGWRWPARRDRRGDAGQDERKRRPEQDEGSRRRPGRARCASGRVRGRRRRDVPRACPGVDDAAVRAFVSFDPRTVARRAVHPRTIAE